MSFNATNQSLVRRDIAGFNGDATSTTHPTLYRYAYATADAAATVEGSGYFDAATWLNAGDIIQAVMALGSTPVLKNYVVTANNLASSGHIVIALQTTTSG